MGLQWQDLGILVVSLVGLILAVYSEGNFSFEHVWFVPVDTSTYRNSHAPNPAERLYV